MRYADARACLEEVARSLAPLLGTEVVSFVHVLDRVVSEDVRSSRAVPPLANSAMDGFAVLAGDVQAGLKYDIAGSLHPGDRPPATALKTGTVWEITTGAPVPAGVDTVVKIEDCSVERDTFGKVSAVSFRDAPLRGLNIRPAGEDYAVGTLVVRRGQRIGAAEWMALASVNSAKISVQRRPRVTLQPTGRELADVGGEIPFGSIVNSSRSYLEARLGRAGADVTVSPILRDDPELFRARLSEACENPPDLFITTGAVSMGNADFVRAELERAGAQILFHRIDVRPGKPILFALFPRGTAKRPFAVFGLPGNPVSTAAGSVFFVEPYLRALLGVEVAKPWQARLTHDVRKPRDLRCFFKAHFELADGSARVTVAAEQGSSLVRPVVASNAWAVLPEGRDQMPAGELVDFHLFTDSFTNGVPHA